METPDRAPSTEKIKDSQQQDIKLALLNVMEDLQQEKEASDKERSKIEAILKSIGDAVFAIDKEGTVILVNNEACKLTGYTSPEIQNKNYKMHFKFKSERGKEDFDALINSVIKTGNPSRMPEHTVLINKDFAEIPVSDSVSPVTTTSGEIIGAVVVFRDSSRERELERTKDNFLSLAAHQLRTPLGGMRWTLELLMSGDLGELGEEAKQALKQIYDNDLRMLVLVNDLLDVSKIDQGLVKSNPEPTDIKECIEQSAKNILPEAVKRGVGIKVSAVGDLPKIYIDPKRLGEIIYNLIANAIKYNHKGGIVTIIAKEIAGTIRVSIMDTGIGIPETDQKRIFDKFYRAKNAVDAETEGSGLGLFVAKSFIEEEGGRIWFESQENKGTTFYIEVPLKKK